MTGVCILNSSAYEAAEHSRVVLLYLLLLLNKQMWGRDITTVEYSICCLTGFTEMYILLIT